MLLQLQEANDEIDAMGAGALGVSTAADHQARWLQRRKGVTYPLLLDPPRQLKDALGIGRMPWWKYLWPRTWFNYLKGALRQRQGMVTASPTELPAVAIIDTDGEVRYLHVGRTLGDYPDIADVLQRLAEVAAES